MPDYAFGQLYERPIQKLVALGEVPLECFQRNIDVLTTAFSFHHSTNPIIYCVSDSLVIVLCNEKANMRLRLDSSNKDKEHYLNSVKIVTINGFPILDVELKEISEHSLNMVLSRLFG